MATLLLSTEERVRSLPMLEEKMVSPASISKAKSLQSLLTIYVTEVFQKKSMESRAAVRW